jgi:PRTRC genetic system protein A
MNIVDAVLARDVMPSIKALGFEYVVAANGLFIRAEDSRMEACALVQAFEAPLFGLAEVEPYARLKLPRVPVALLETAYRFALDNLPREVMVQFSYADGVWWLATPAQAQTRTSVAYEDAPSTVLDLHSHGRMQPFWSSTDNADEKGLRFYAVIGGLSHGPFMPHICLRAGVYGHYVDIGLDVVFDTEEMDFAGPFSRESNEQFAS